MNTTQMKNSTIFLIGILAFLYYFTAELQSQFVLYADIVNTIVFPAEGIALAFVLYYGKKMWPGIFIGQFFIAYTHDMGLAISLIIASINSIEAILAVILFKHFKLNTKLNHFRDFIGLFILIIFVLQPFSSLAANISLLSFGYLKSSDFLNSSFSWWFGNIMGQFLFTPLFLTFFNHYKKLKIGDFLLYNLAFGGYIFILLSFLHITSSLLLLSLTLPILIYIIYIKDTFYSLFMIATMSYILAFFLVNKTGPFLYQDGTIQLIDYNLYLLTLTITTLTAKILFENYKRQHENLQELIKVEIEKNREQQFFMLHQSKLAQMGEMITMIAHQWRQPLNNLSLLHQLVISKHKNGKLDDEMIEYFKKYATIHTDMMSDTINNFKNFFKPEENKNVFNINEVIFNILNIIKPALEKEKIKIIFLTQNQYQCFGYKNSFGHAILNIINNAKDALVEQELKNKTIVIEIIEEDNKLIVSIKDNAGGISETIKDKIFDPYFSTKLEKEGTGLGLYITNLIITEHMDAKLQVYNDHNGAVFNIILKGELSEKLI